MNLMNHEKLRLFMTIKDFTFVESKSKGLSEKTKAVSRFSSSIIGAPHIQKTSRTSRVVQGVGWGSRRNRNVEGWWGGPLIESEKVSKFQNVISQNLQGSEVSKFQTPHVQNQWNICSEIASF